jgi:hypothetical protein
MLVGTMLLAIALLHLLVGVVLYRDVLLEVAREGVLATVPDFGDRAAAYWFLITGLCLFALGACVRDAERERSFVPRSLPATLALLTFAIVAPMPVSCGWLIAPVAWLAYRRVGRAQ